MKAGTLSTVFLERMHEDTKKRFEIKRLSQDLNQNTFIDPLRYTDQLRSPRKFHVPISNNQEMLFKKFDNMR